MRYKAVLFDMDGTILDTLDDLTDAVNHTLNKFGYPQITRQQCAQNLGNGARHLIKESMPANADNLDEMLDYYLPYYNSHCLVKTYPFDGILPLMKKLADEGVKMAVISNKPDSAAKELSDVFFRNIVDFTIGESKNVKRKPNPDAVLQAIKEFGIDKSECVYVGDTEVDVETAKNAGIDCIAVGWGFRTEDELKKSGADVIVHNCDELLERLL